MLLCKKGGLLLPFFSSTELKARYSYSGNIAHSRIWTHFGFKKINVGLPTEENLLNIVFLLLEILSKSNYESLVMSLFIVTCLFTFILHYTIKYKNFRL